MRTASIEHRPNGAFRALQVKGVLFFVDEK